MDEKGKEFVAERRWEKNQKIIFFTSLIALIALTVFLLTVFAPIAIICIFGALAIYYMFNTFKSEYAYTVSQRLTVEIIRKNNKRTTVGEFFMSDMTMCAPYVREEYAEYKQDVDEVINAATDEKDKKTYFAIFERANKKKMLLFTPGEMMLNELDRHTSHKSIR